MKTYNVTLIDHCGRPALAPEDVAWAQSALALHADLKTVAVRSASADPRLRISVTVVAQSQGRAITIAADAARSVLAQAESAVLRSCGDPEFAAEVSLRR